MMRTRGIGVAALLGGLLLAASAEAAEGDKARAPMGDVFSSQGRPNTTGTTGTQGVQGNPNCPQPVINGIRPKNWSCKTGTQAPGRPAAPQRPWLDQFFFPSAAAQEPIPGYVEQFNSNGQPATPVKPYPYPEFFGSTTASPPTQQTRPVQQRPRPNPQQPVYEDQLYGEGYIKWVNGELLGYKVRLNVDASSKSAVTNIKLEGGDKARYDKGKAVIVGLRGERTGTNTFTTTGVWVKPLGKNSAHGEFCETTDYVPLQVIRVRVR